MDRSHSEEGRWNNWKKGIGLEPAGSQKERKAEASVEKDHSGGSRKMWQNMEWG
jgi:hypothetical protein